MLFTAALLVLPFGLAVAAPSATVPGPNDKYTEGGNCTIAWMADTSGLWTTMNIELMTGPNSPMVHLRTVATVNAQTTTSFSWPCPMVSPNSAIYFYQFSSQQDQANTNWATRFLIAATDGSSTPPTDVTSTGVAYGLGSLVDPTLYNAPPAYLIGNGQVVGAPNTTAPGPVSLAASSSSTSPSSSTDTASSLSLSASGPQSPSTISSSQSSTSTSSASTSSATSGSIRKATATISGASLWVITASVALLGTIAGTLL